MGYESDQPERCAEHASSASMCCRCNWADEAEQAQAALVQLEKHEADKAVEQAEWRAKMLITLGVEGLHPTSVPIDRLESPKPNPNCNCPKCNGWF
jgi:hypothetical protein